jgi:predicted nuclease of predicted toxin-antitoxin system
VKIKLDENLPSSLREQLASLGHDVHTAVEEGLGGTPDSSLFEVVQNEGRFFITQDLDFSDVRQLAPGTHHGILLIRLSEPSRRRLEELVVQLFRGEEAASWGGCFVVATDKKLRVRRP